MPSLQDAQHALSMSPDELYETLGVSDMGSESFNDAVNTRLDLHAAALNTNPVAARASLTGKLLSRGKAVFARLWGEAKKLVCFIHRSDAKLDGDANLVKYLAGVVVAALKWNAGIALAVVTIAFKHGLDQVCPVESH
jgi:hypothetical protein